MSERGGWAKRSVPTRWSHRPAPAARARRTRPHRALCELGVRLCPPCGSRCSADAPDPLFWYGLPQDGHDGDDRGRRIGRGRAQRTVDWRADRGAADRRPALDLPSMALEHPRLHRRERGWQRRGDCGGRDLRAHFRRAGATSGHRAQHRRATLVWFSPPPDCASSTGPRRARSRSMRSCSPSPSRPRRAIAAPRCRARRSSARAMISAARGDSRAGGRGGDDGESSNRLVRLRRIRRVSDRDGELRGDPASARRRTGGGRRARACGAGARRPGLGPPG